MSSGRIFNCALCHQQVIICSCCDHGNIYCGESCAKEARKKSLHEAGKRYQNTFRGKINHAKRQLRYRKRITKVTHHSSKEVVNNDLLRKAENKLIRNGDLHCDFCGCKCKPYLRTDFLTTSVVKNYDICPQGP